MKRLLALFVALGLGVTLAGQQSPVFKSAVDLVTLDVTVLDSQRRPIRDLGPVDFTVLEDGKPQQIAVFNAVNIPDVEPPKTAWLRDIAPDVRTNEDNKERRMFLIIVDDATVEADVFALKQLKEQTKRVIDKLGPSDLAAVIFTMDNRKSTDFTSDRARLLKVVDSQPMGFRGMGMSELSFTDDWYLNASVDVMRRSVETLATMPDRHRSVIYIGAGVPVDLGLVAEPASAGVSADSSQTISASVVNASQQAHLMSKTFQASARGNVPINTIDVCGLRLPAQAGATGKQTCADGLPNEYLRNIAVGTGGRAVVDTNEFDPGVDAIFRENSSYYLLGYQSTNPQMDGKFRRIEVRVNRPNANIKTRSGYIPEKAEDVAKRKAQMAAQPLGAAIAGVLPKGDLPMRLSAAPFAIPGKKESSVLVMLGVSQPIRETGARTAEKVDLQVRAYNTDGRLFGYTNLRAEVTVRPNATGLAEYEVMAQLDLKPGRYQLRTAANVGALGVSGSLYYDVDVPDFSDAPVSLSGLVLTATPALPIGGAKPILPVRPTTQRVFAPGTEVAAFFRVYAGGRKPPETVEVRIRVRNSQDIPVLDRRETIEGAAFSMQRYANVNIALPVSRLPAGEYLLTVEAPTAQGVITRTLRFAVGPR